MRSRVLLPALLALSWPRWAIGADESTTSALIRDGAEHFKREDYEGARAAFARAYELEPKAATLFNLALSELNSGHPVEAVAHLREYLTHTDEPAAKLDSARTKWLLRAEARTARLDVFAAQEAQLSVDGVAQEHGSGATGPAGSPISIAIAAGEHEVTARQGNRST
jgi:tetratricopeptide (TPR) repeat protein